MPSEGFYVNEKFQWPQLGSNQRPSDLWHSTLTTVLPHRKDFMSMKNPLTPSGIEPATFRFVAQHLNHCATASEGFYVNEKFQWHQLGSNQRPSDLLHSNLTTVLPHRKEFMSTKNPLTPSGIEPATFRFVAQHLSHCATASEGFYDNEKSIDTSWDRTSDLPICSTALRNVMTENRTKAGIWRYKFWQVSADTRRNNTSWFCGDGDEHAENNDCSLWRKP